MNTRSLAVSLITAATLGASSLVYGHNHEGGSDWPMWGGSADRNMVGNSKNLPVDIKVGEVRSDETVDLTDAKNVLWVAKLGSQSYGNATVASGTIFLGTNNESPRDPKQLGDRGVLLALDEETGDFKWQLLIPKLGAGKVSDWEYVGLCSSAAVDGDELYIVTNRGEVVCLDVNGLADGNDGEFQDEATYMSANGEPVELNDQYADVLWIFDMREELGVFPHNVSSCSPLVVDGIVYVATSNGVDWSHNNIPAPFSPALIALDQKTGQLIGEEASGVSERVLHASWSSPAYGEVAGKPMIVWGGGDGFAYGFNPKPEIGPDGYEILKEVWRYDGNTPEYREKRYATYPGPSEIIGTVILNNDTLYAMIGQDPEHGDGVGRLSAIDATLEGDISANGAKWTYTDIGRSVSTMSIYNGMVFALEYDGDIHCLNADTGELYWKHETLSRVWGSTLVADGKVYAPNEDGQMVILAATPEKKVLATVEFGAPIYSSPIVAHDVVYIATQTHLYALKKGAHE